MKPSKSTTLRRTLSKLLLVASLVAAVVVALAVSVYEQTTFKPRVVSSLQQQADTLATVILPPLEFNDTLTATKYLETRRDYPDVVAAGLYTAEGERVASYVRSADIQVSWPDRPSEDGYQFIGKKLHLWRSVQGFGAVEGHLFLCAEIPPLYARLPQYGIMAGAVTLALLAASLLLLHGMTVYLLRPLQALTDTTERVKQDKNIDVRAPVESTDEIGRLGTALNDMLATVQRRDLELRNSENRLRSIIDNEPECVKVLGLNSELIEINPVGLQFLEARSFDEASSKPFLEFIDAASRDRFRQLIRRVLAGAKEGVEFELVGLKGGRRWMDARAVPMRNNVGEITSVLAISRDVTERRQFERALAKRSSQQAVMVRLGLEAFSAPSLDSLLQRATAAIKDALECDLVGIFEVQQNGQTAKLQAGKGWDSELIGQLVISIGADTQAARMLKEQTPVLIGDLGTDTPVALPLLRIRYGVHSSASVAVRGANQAWGFIAVHSKAPNAYANDDVRVLQEVANLLAQAVLRLSADAARRSIESQLLQSQKMEALGRLAGGIAHDFNNLLSAILGNVRLAKEDIGPDHSAMVSLDEIQSAGIRSKELVQRILAFSRNQEPCKEFVRLQTIVEEATRLMRATIPASIEIAVHLDAEAPPTMADSGQVHQCVLNLATNAWQAIGPRPGRIDFRLKVVEIAEAASEFIRLKSGRYIRIEVEDNGGGMDERTRDHIFEPFFTTKPLGEGTGLGLSMVHGIMESHGGAVDVQSEIGRGSLFALYFPVIDAASTARESIEAKSSEKMGRKGSHILYVDDEEPLVFLATRLLERLGYRVTGYTDPGAAVEAFKAQPDSFDLVVTDLSMPGLSGMEVARAILATRPDTLVVLASGYLRQADVDAAKAIGIRDVILKPNTVDALGPIVQRLVAAK